MGNAGLSKSRLGRMHRVLSGYVERRDVPGFVALVSRHDDIHVETLGTLSFGDPAPMRRDTIFRIASITKPARLRGCLPEPSAGDRQSVRAEKWLAFSYSQA